LLYTDLKIILLDHQNNFVGMSDAVKNSSLSVLHNYFEQNYFSDLHPARILDLSAKLFFLCKHLILIIYKYLILDAKIFNVSFLFSKIQFYKTVKIFKIVINNIYSD